jgi:hypothetical protein
MPGPKDAGSSTPGFRYVAIDTQLEPEAVERLALAAINDVI